MSTVREERLYKAYCDLCYYTDKKPLQKPQWAKGLQKPIRSNRTAADIKNELVKLREHT